MKSALSCRAVLILLLGFFLAASGFVATETMAAAAKPASGKAVYPPPPAPGAPVTLDDTIYGVLRYHRALRGMQENRQVLEHEVRRAQAGFGPSVDITGEAGGNLLSDRTTRDYDLDKQMYGIGEISGRLTQPIWDGFATRSRVAAPRRHWNP